ncbi:uncharacterized protein LOC119996357 isoform X2 [Tripterygium wilfordii]|uniref:uncharacterized protein LOC119996357 isoform X2 n=1 Tax=Tripterygium wilfordii TaxID=458696 RepID=UPI0018F85A37|nr:uncharacterized protein LOC119996357 isoform X2 [Tripterygium wilfordii]
MVWMVNQEITKGNRRRSWGGAFLCWVCLMLVTPKIPLSPEYHLFADMRNFLGVPNTLNVITNFPFLIVGVLCFVLCLQGSFFNISLRGEGCGWTIFFAGIAGMAFGSAYYHLKPDDNRVMLYLVWNIYKFCAEWVAVDCRTFNDLRLCMMFQLIPCIAIPTMNFLFPPKYTHSRFWIWAAGVSLFAKCEGCLDRRIYRANRYYISGHSLEHLCSALIPVLLAYMLMYRNLRFQRDTYHSISPNPKLHHIHNGGKKMPECCLHPSTISSSIIFHT